MGEPRGTVPHRSTGGQQALCLEKDAQGMHDSASQHWPGYSCKAEDRFVCVAGVGGEDAGL